MVYPNATKLRSSTGEKGWKKGKQGPAQLMNQKGSLIFREGTLQAEAMESR